MATRQRFVLLVTRRRLQGQLLVTTWRCIHSGWREFLGMILERLPELMKLSPSEKLQLAEELWEEASQDPEAFPMSPEIVAELERRMEHHRLHPEDAIPWEEVKERLIRGK